MNNSLSAAGQPVTYHEYLLEFWVPQHVVSSTFTLVWGLGHVFEGKLYFTKDIVDDSFVPKGTGTTN